MTSAAQASAHHCRLGDLDLTVISDGYLDTSFGILRGIEPDEATALLAAASKPSPARIAVNAFVIRDGRRTILIEAGSGSSMGPTLGHLPANLRAAGIDPASIDTVLLTHMHPDHSNGLTDDDGNRHFPNAELLIHENEVAHWTDDGRMAQANERQRVRYFEAARRQLLPYRENLRTIREGEVVPGIHAMSIAGHTPGHTAYTITSGAHSVMIWGDTVHIPEIQIPRPDVTLEFDSDSHAAAAMRRRVLDMAAADNLLVAGMHLDFPGFARIHRVGSDYRFTADPLPAIRD